VDFPDLTHDVCLWN